MNIIFTEQIVEGFAYNSSAGVYVKVITPSPCILELGKEYIVKWDDTEYSETAFPANINGYEMVAIGNKAIAGGDNTGESFAIAYNPTTDYLNLFAMTADASHNIAIYTSAEEIETPDEPEEPIEPEETTGVTITLYDRTGAAVKYENVETITTDTPDREQGATFTYGVAVENAEYEPDFSDGNQKVTLEKGQLLKEFAIIKPENLLPEYIKKNVEVAGVVGEFAGDETEKTVELEMADGDQVIEADEDTVLTKVIVKKPETLTPENIVKGANIGGVIGTHTGEFGIYADGGNGREWIEPSRIMPYMFYSNQTLTSESFPNVLDVGTFAFYSVKNLNRIDLPMCSNIGSYAFTSCYSLAEVNLPICTSIPPYAFQSCSALKMASFPECITISNHAFANCKNLETLYIPKCTSIASGSYSYVFIGCSNLSNLILGEVPIYRYMFSSIANNKLLTISGSAIIWSSAFASGLMSGLSLQWFKTIYPMAFASCSNLMQVCIKTPGIWTSLFYRCSKLKRVVAPGLSRVATGAFSSCSSLAFFSGKCLSYISSYAFYDCRNFSVFLLSSYVSLTKSIGNFAFANTPLENSTYLGYYGSFYVPESYLASYQADSYWASYSARFAPLTSEILALCEWEDL